MSFSFDTVAPIYDTLARLVFGRSIERAQTYFLKAIPANANVLIIGGGTGWIIQKLLQKRQVNRIDYVEASYKMLQLARHKYNRIRQQQSIGWPTKVTFIQGTEKNLPQDTVYDAILTFFVLDTKSDTTLPDMMKILYAHLKKSGLWLFADFKISTKSHERWWHQLLVNMMFLFFRLTCHLQNDVLPDYDRVFSQLKLFKVKEKTFYSNLIISELYKKI
jgi:hypothetical protein